MNEPKLDTVAETESYMVWTSQEPDGEQIYHIELGNITLHLFAEEWDEFVDLMTQATR